MTRVRPGIAVAAIVLALSITGCGMTPPAATPRASAASSPPAAPSSDASPAPAASTTPSPTPSDPLDGWQEIATPNGTATFRIPPGWTAEMGGEEVDYDGETHWMNEITLADAEDRLHLGYVDGPFDDVGAHAHFGVVRSMPVATLDEEERAAVVDTDPGSLDHHVVAWWTTGDEVTFTAHAGLANPSSGEIPPTAIVTDGERTVSFGVRDEFSSEADAVAWLESDDVTLLLEIAATLDLTAIPAPALP